jgi:hypothetical protein
MRRTDASPLRDQPASADGLGALNCCFGGKRQVFAGDVSPVLAADMAATQRPAASGAVSEAAAQAAWHTIPSWYLVARQDHAIAPDLECFIAARARPHR